MTDETKTWFSTLPDEMKLSITTHDRISRDKLLNILTDTRVLLAPSLLDGIPNVLYEAMAAGVVPIVSPIETLTGVFKDQENVLYARNLYVKEIEDALIRSMNDGEIVKKIVANNLLLVKKMADRSELRTEFVDFYKKIGQIKDGKK